MLCEPGDAYRYTIQPVFQNIKTEFQCHIELVRPHDVLYELFFFIQIPGTVVFLRVARQYDYRIRRLDTIHALASQSFRVAR